MSSLSCCNADVIDEKENKKVKKVNRSEEINVIEEYKTNDLKDFYFPIIEKGIIEEVEKKIKDITGFQTYGPMKIKLNMNKQKIEGTYNQYNRGCILYALINNGYIDEKYIPESMKYYKDHHHREEAYNGENLLKRAMSVIDLAQLWINIGGECPYLEIDLEEAKKRIYSFLNEHFDKVDDKNFMTKVFAMTWQCKDYFELLGKLEKNIKKTLFAQVPEIKDNPCIKSAIDKNIIKERDIIKYGRHCFIFEKTFEENNKKKYIFQDSLAYFRDITKDQNYNNCDFTKKGYISANEDSKFINLKDTKELEIGLVEVINS